MSDPSASQSQEPAAYSQASQASTAATGASASKWRHQESSRYHRHARDATGSSTNTSSLAAFLHSSRVESTGNGSGAGHRPLEVSAGNDSTDAAAADGHEIICGPLLNYQRTVDGCWHGSVLIVVNGGGLDVQHQPSMHLQKAAKKAAAATAAEAAGTTVEGAAEASVTDPAADAAAKDQNPIQAIQGERLYSDKRNTFWAFHIEVPVEAAEARYEYGFADMRITSSDKPPINAFSVPAAAESMRIMFHSCNGFSVGTDEDAYSGAPLWNDVMRKHEAAPFHAMLGGGDQIYNDGIRVQGPLRAWTGIGNPKKRREFPFNESLRADCDQYYLDNYVRWYNTAPFCYANGQIPQINIWDDHDIIDGFGSYVDRFMRCDVFRGIGGTAHKYYLLFQHHMAPPKSTYTSDHKGNGPDPVQSEGVFVAEPNVGEQYIVGSKPGPYVEERSFNMYTRLGARMAMLGIDARTERTRRQVNYPETYKLIFDRLRSELKAAASSGQPIQHLILLLGIPIAYPRLTWLENILRSPLIGPIKFLNRRFGVGGGFFNHFDGSVDLLDDLDDHYTAKTHKVERRELITTMQAIAAEYSVRVTILGGDVHLAALGRFYANPKSKVPVEEDHRYMANVVSSAIVNKPPPQAVANLLARRNKIHHLDAETDETMLNLFNKDPGTDSRTAGFNHCTMPSRNFAMLRENSPNNPAPAETNGDASSISFAGRDGHKEMHRGEVGAGTEHRAATDRFGMANDGGLDIRINVEIDQHSSEGKTQAYGLTVPTLKSTSSGSSAPVLPPVSTQDKL